MNRSVRRRQERYRNRNKPTLIVSDNMIAMPLGERFAPPERMAQSGPPVHMLEIQATQ